MNFTKGATFKSIMLALLVTYIVLVSQAVWAAKEIHTLDIWPLT